METSFPNITNNVALNFLNSKLIKHGRVIDLIDTTKSLKYWSETPHERETKYNLQLSIFNSCLEKIEDISLLISFRDELQKVLFDIILEEKSTLYLKNIIETNLINNPLSVIFVEDNPMYVPVENGLEGIKSVVFLSLIDLIESGEVNFLRRCANPECFSIFPTRSGRRKWCSMKICGNRHKVEQYEKRQKKSSH